MLAPADTTQEVVGVYDATVSFNFAFLGKMIRRVATNCESYGAN